MIYSAKLHDESACKSYALSCKRHQEIASQHRLSIGHTAIATVLWFHRSNGLCASCRARDHDQYLVFHFRFTKTTPSGNLQVKELKLRPAFRPLEVASQHLCWWTIAINQHLVQGHLSSGRQTSTVTTWILQQVMLIPMCAKVMVPVQVACPGLCSH